MQTAIVADQPRQPGLAELISRSALDRVTLSLDATSLKGEDRRSVAAYSETATEVILPTRRPQAEGRLLRGLTKVVTGKAARRPSSAS